MRIVYFNHNVVGTGTYLRAFRLAAEVAQHGHDVTVVTTSAHARYGVTRRREAGVTIVEAPDLTWGRARTGWDPYNTLVRCLSVTERDVDLIHAFDSRPAVIIPALYLRKKTDATLVMDWADWWGRGGTIVERTPGPSRHVIEPVETWFEEHFRTEANFATTICTPLLERVVSLGVPRERVRLVPNGCAEIPRIGRYEARRRLGIAGDTPLLVHLGASFRRDIQLMLDAFTAVRQRIPKAELVFAGSLPVALPALPGVRALGRVSVDDVGYWLAAADACVLPLCDTIANRGRWPSKVNEYLSAGRAVAMTNVGDVADWIRKHECGVVAPASAEPFGTALVGLLGAEADRAAAEANAISLARGPLAWSSIARNVTDMYEQTRGRVAALSA